jgi:hypothetical protein
LKNVANKTGDERSRLDEPPSQEEATKYSGRELPRVQVKCPEENCRGQNTSRRPIPAQKTMKKETTKKQFFSDGGHHQELKG